MLAVARRGARRVRARAGVAVAPVEPAPASARAGLTELQGRINLAARLYRHARSLARDVADSNIRSPELADATRAIAEAADLELRGEDATAACRGAAAVIELGADDAVVIRARLSQMLADLDPAHASMRALLHRG